MKEIDIYVTPRSPGDENGKGAYYVFVDMGQDQDPWVFQYADKDLPLPLDRHTAEMVARAVGGYVVQETTEFINEKGGESDSMHSQEKGLGTDDQTSNPEPPLTKDPW